MWLNQLKFEASDFAYTAQLMGALYVKDILVTS